MDSNSQRLSLRLIVVSVFAAAMVTYLFTMHGQTPKFDDFNVYYVAGIKAFHHKTVFDVQGHLQFKYSPWVALLFGCTFSFLPYRLAAWGYYAICAAVWLAFVLMIAEDAAIYYRRRLPPYITTATATWAGALLFFVFFCVGLRDELKLGQMNVVPVALSYVAFRKVGHDGITAVKTGLLLALAIQFKLYCLIFLPLLVFRRAWATLFFTLASIAVMSYGWLAAFDGAAFALEELRQWLVTLSASSAGLITNGFNISILGVLTRHFGPHTWISVIWGAAVMLFLSLAFAMRNADPIYGCLFAMAAIVPLNPLAWPYWILFVAPAWIYVGLPSALGVRRQSPMRTLWLYGGAGLFFAFSLQQNQPLSHRWGILLITLLFLAEFVSWFRREVILFRRSPKWAEEMAEKMRRENAETVESAE